jgi:hypothetical protein
MGGQIFWFSLLDGLDEVRSEEELETKLDLIEGSLPTFHTAPEAPYFHLAPPTFCSPDTWWSLLRDFPVEEATGRRLLANGFMPFDRERFMRRALVDPWQAMSPNRRYVYLDLDYGILIFDREQGGFDFCPLNLRELERYRQRHPTMPSYSGVYALAQYRADLLYAVAGAEPVYECQVASRAELDQAIGLLREGAKKFPQYQIWFRGQNTDFLLPDLANEVKRGICPWRAARDSSLVPSLYRPGALLGRIGDWREYCQFGIEYGRFIAFMNRTLDIPDLGDDEMGLAYRSIQGSFFLQHYGLPSSIMDVTRDLDVALFFAQYEASGGNKTLVDFEKQRPVIYVLILNPAEDLVVDSAALLEGKGLLRPLHQKCGLIAGASFANRNAYAKFIALKVQLANRIDAVEHALDYIYPTRSEDEFLDRLLGFKESAGLTRLSPNQPSAVPVI